MKKVTYVCDKCGSESEERESVFVLADGRCLCETCAREALDGVKRDPYNGAAAYRLRDVVRRYGISAGAPYRRLEGIVMEFCGTGKARRIQAGKNHAVLVQVRPEYDAEWWRAIDEAFGGVQAAQTAPALPEAEAAQQMEQM